ncbi:MAG: response regulator, partial [Firmicutes bacterium]|nr:response regulator [Bacillota bacterium]
MRKTVFVVDDSDTNLLVAEEALEKHFRVLPLPSAEKMFFMMQRIRPDLILLDIDMPVMDGFEAIKILKIDNGYKTIPVMFLTSYNDAVTEVRGFELGAVDFISKPFSPPVLINRIRMHLEIGELIKRRTEELTRLQNGIILTLTDVIESRNQGAEVHVEYTAGYIKILVDAMVARGIYAEETKKINFDSARLHDVGKIAIPDVILNKPGPLTGDEFTIMKTHAAEGEKIIDQIIDRIGSVDFLSCARVFAGAHHERF